MHRSLNVIIAVILGIPLVALSFWYALAFLPHLAELKSISTRGTKSIEGVERMLYPLAVSGETKELIRSYAISQAYSTLVHEKKPGRALEWHASRLLWYSASFIHFNEREIFGLWVECALYRCEGGLKSAARKYYSKELHDLSEKELAGLAAMIKSPSLYAPGTEAGDKRANEILGKAKAMTARPNSRAPRP